MILGYKTTRSICTYFQSNIYDKNQLVAKASRIPHEIYMVKIVEIYQENILYMDYFQVKSQLKTWFWVL